MHKRRAAAIGAALACTMAVTETRADETCTSVTHSGWYTCVDEGVVAAMPFYMLDIETVYAIANHYPVAICEPSAWYALLSDDDLRVVFVSGGPTSAEGDAYVEVATGGPGAPEPVFVRYEAHVKTTPEQRRHPDDPYHIATVRGADARALLKQVSATEHRSWLWRIVGDDTVRSVEIRTLAHAAQRVLDACGGDNG